MASDVAELRLRRLSQEHVNDHTFAIMLRERDSFPVIAYNARDAWMQAWLKVLAAPDADTECAADIEDLPSVKISWPL